MDHPQWVIQVLEDSHNGRIEDNNRVWLQENVRDLHIYVDEQNCSIDVLSLGYRFFSSEAILIQDGKQITNGENFLFNHEKEALLVYKANGEDLFIFLYEPNK